MGVQCGNSFAITRWKRLTWWRSIRLVVDVCREYLSATAGALGDPRVTIHYTDGVEYMRDCRTKV